MDPDTISAETYHHFENSFDSTYGGFGSAPKFPTPVQLQFLIDYYMFNRRNAEKSRDAQNALEMALFTLKKIASGGIHGNKPNWELTYKLTIFVVVQYRPHWQRFPSLQYR